MPHEDIIRIATTSAIVQALISLAFNSLVFSKEDYERAVSQMERSKQKRDKIAKSNADILSNALTPSETTTYKNKKIEREMQKKIAEETNARIKAEKKLKKADEEYNEMASRVAHKHSFPNMVNSLFFIILARVLGTEYTGKVIAVLPFVPPNLLRKLTQRGLETGIDPRACSFTFIFILCSLSVKYIASSMFGQQMPAGVGLTNFLESPKAQRLLQKYGLDTSEIDVKKAK